MLEGCADWKHPSGVRIALSTFIEAHRAVKQKPIYTGLSQEQLDLCGKLRDTDYGILATLVWYKRAFGCSRESAAKQIARMGIPTYLGPYGNILFFVGDLAKALSARKIDLLAYGAAEIRSIAYRYRRRNRHVERSYPSGARFHAIDYQDADDEE